MVEFDKYCISRKQPSQNEELILFNEVDGVCPKCGCSLISEESKKIKLYEIAHIFPNSPTEEEKALLANVEVLGENSEDIKNKIALCRDCHKEYDYHKTVEEYEEYLMLKKDLIKKHKAKNLLASKSLEPELINAIKQIGKLTSEELSIEEPLSLSAVNVNEKIATRLLERKISKNVVDFFPTIKRIFHIQEEENENYSFSLIASNIKHSYEISKAQRMSESEIFDSLCGWIENKSHCSKEVSEILISFFTQNCDAYEKISR